MSTVTIPQENRTTLPEEFERLYREHATFVYRTALRITRNAEEAEDILQTIFLRLLRRESSPDLQKRPRAYLYRAAVNAALDAIESRRNRSGTADVSEIEATLHSPDSNVKEKLHQQLHKAIAELNPTAAEILILRYIAFLPAGTPSYKLQDIQRGNAPRLQRMLRNLLADRFRLVLKHEFREMSVYALTVANRGKMDGRLSVPFPESGFMTFSRQKLHKSMKT